MLQSQKFLHILHLSFAMHTCVHLSMMFGQDLVHVEPQEAKYSLVNQACIKVAEIVVPQQIKAEADGRESYKFFCDFHDCEYFLKFINMSPETALDIQNEYLLLSNSFQKETDFFIKKWTDTNCPKKREQIEKEFSCNVKNCISSYYQLTVRRFTCKQRKKIELLYFAYYDTSLTHIPIFAVYENIQLSKKQRKALILLKKRFVSEAAENVINMIVDSMNGSVGNEAMLEKKYDSTINCQQKAIYSILHSSQKAQIRHIKRNAESHLKGCGIICCPCPTNGRRPGNGRADDENGGEMSDDFGKTITEKEKPVNNDRGFRCRIR